MSALHTNSLLPRPLRVLLVDDDEFMLDVAVELLVQGGVTDVHRSSDGVSALRIVDDPQRHPDVILCDLDMAGMDGFVFMRKLADRSYSGAVIVMSGSDERVLASVTELVREHKLNILEALTKPLAPKQLFRALDRLGGLRPGASELDVVVGQAGSVPGHAGGLLTASEVRRGLDAGCVGIAVQPKVRLSDRRVVGAEALLRWNDPLQGAVMPFAVIPTAEAHGLIDDLTLDVYRQSVTALAEWRASGHDLTIAVNLSALTLTSLDFPERVEEIARQAGIEPGCITLEVTESRLLEELVSSLEVIGRLRLKGFRLSIDDFGTGYASMGNLKMLPFTELKIDRSFVQGAVVDVNDVASRIILGCSVELGHALKMSVVAEGVETVEEWNLLEGLGCDEIQGYLVAKPMPPGDFPSWKTAWELDPPERRVFHPAGAMAWRV